MHVPRGSVDNCRLVLREIVKLNGSGFGGGCGALYVFFRYSNEYKVNLL